MSNFLQWLLGNGLVRTQVTKFVANISAKAGVAVATTITAVLVNHGYSIDQAMGQHIGLVGTALAGLIVACGQVFYDVVTDPNRVNVALKASAQAGVVIPPPAVSGVKVGDAIEVNGQTITIGKPSPSDNPSVTASLNKSQT